MVRKTAIKLVPWLGSFRASGYDAILNLFASRVLKGAIVVLDDIERKDTTLRLSASSAPFQD